MEAVLITLGERKQLESDWTPAEQSLAAILMPWLAVEQPGVDPAQTAPTESPALSTRRPAPNTLTRSELERACFQPVSALA